MLPKSELNLPNSLVRKQAPRWPRISEPEMVRHYTWLSKRNFGIDTGFYPLGSCTMKHNPRVNEVIAQLPGIADIHPHQPEHHLQGLLSIYHEMQYMLEMCAGMDQVTLQPVAGAQGEFTAVRCIQEYFRLRGEDQRTKVIVPDSAHGTNPASAAMCGFEIVEIPSRVDGRIDLDALRAVADETTAVMMITNPNTLGLFEADILEATSIVHDVGGQMYYDGANFNAILGITSPGLMGFDAVHFNLHKTFSQPHGGGGPGSGPIGVKAHLADFLPGPIVEKRPIVGDEAKHAIGDAWFGWHQPVHSIGKVQQWHGNAGAIIRCWAYYRRYGNGLKTMSEHAVLNANYLRHAMHREAAAAGVADMIVDGAETDVAKHEFTISLGPAKESHGISAMDVAKGLLDMGYMAPTVYFPLVVPECMMVEPTETESKETLDTFAEDFAKVLQVDAETLHAAPITTPVRRVDEVYAARNLCLRHPYDDE
jgi:glycine dehydrogenase subunit 2